MDLLNSRQRKINFGVSFDCRLRLLEYFFLTESFSKKETAFSYFFLLLVPVQCLLLVPVQCLDKTFLYFIFSQSRKILSYFSKLSAIIKCRGKNFVVMTSIVRLSSKRS